MFSLRWYILGKHSDFVFTENTNSQLDLENRLLTENECLTGQMLNSSTFETDDPTEITNVQSNIGSECTPIISEQCFDLLKEFEVNKKYFST